MVQSEIAAALGYTQGSVAHWMTGRQRPPAHTVKKIIALQLQNPDCKNLQRLRAIVTGKSLDSRRAFKVTLKAIADECGVSVYQVWEWAHGRPISEQYADRVMTFLRDIPDDSILPEWLDTLIKGLGVKL